MTNKQKNKIIDRAISFIEEFGEKHLSRISAAHIEELKLLKNENVFAKEPRKNKSDKVRKDDEMVVSWWIFARK